MTWLPRGVGSFWFRVGDSDEAFTYEQLVTAARHVAWHYSIGNPHQFHPPGDMLQHTMRAMAHADPPNMARLCRAFPLYGALMNAVEQDDADGRDMIFNLLQYQHVRNWSDKTENPTSGPEET